MRTRRASLVPLLLGMLLVPPPTTACGPFFPVAIFTYSVHPDFPPADFAAGNLGILQPTYARSYLYAAYRHLIGIGFTPAEQRGLLNFWQKRLREQFLSWDSPEQSLFQQWLEGRNKVPGVPRLESLPLYRSSLTSWLYSAYPNCLGDAFRSALNTLNQRIQQFGAESEEVRNWLEAQDHVFANCGGPDPVSGKTAIPSPAPPNLHPVIQADRAYQIAAAYFYAGDFGKAAILFEKIAKDTTSPWATWAPYLVARCEIRRGALIDPEALASAEAQLNKILKDPALKQTHAAARRLLNFVRFRLYPRQRARELAQTLLGPIQASSFPQDLTDYLLLLDKLIGQEVEWEYGEKKRTLFAQKWSALADARMRDELADWLLSFQAQSPQGLEHALIRWKATNSLPWLVAALAKLTPTHPQADEVVEAAGRIPPESPAFATLTFHRMRLRTQMGQTEAAREELDTLLRDHPHRFPPSSRNLLLTLRMKLAHTLVEFLTFAQQIPATVTTDESAMELPDEMWSRFWREWFKEQEGKEIFSEAEARHREAAQRPLFPEGAAKVVNELLPLALFKQAALSTGLAPHLRLEVALAAWTRAVLLDNHAVAMELVPVLEELAPALKSLLRNYVTAQNEEERQFAAIFLLLKSPGLRPYVMAGIGREPPLTRIDSYRENWWCSFNLLEELHDRNFSKGYPEGTKPLQQSGPYAADSFPSFLNEAQKATVREEWGKSFGLGTAPNYLSQRVLEWAKKHPDDPRVPEALHLAVKSTRYGCTDEQTTTFSRSAFRLLHRRYPKSEWAKKTKHWY